MYGVLLVIEKQRLTEPDDKSFSANIVQHPLALNLVA